MVPGLLAALGEIFKGVEDQRLTFKTALMTR